MASSWSTLVPELALIIGEPPPAPDLPPQDQQARFQLVFRRFLDVFARPEHPLTLFLDDLQWLDAATLDLIEHLITHPDVRHLLLVGAYRDNEVGPAHPLARTLARLRGTGERVREIGLAPLGPWDVARLLADALRQSDGRVRPLADLVFEKTAAIRSSRCSSSARWTTRRSWPSIPAWRPGHGTCRASAPRASLPMSQISWRPSCAACRARPAMP